MINHHYLPLGLLRLPPPGRLSCSRLRAHRVSGPSTKWLLHASTIGPDALRTATCPRTDCPLQVHQVQLASGAMSNFCSAVVENTASSVKCAQPCCTTGRSDSAAARRHIDLNPTNDLGLMGAIVLAYISSSTLLTHTCTQSAHSNMATRRGCAHCARLGGPYLQRGV